MGTGSPQGLLATTDAGAGVKSFWSYYQQTIPGLGTAFLNVGTGNLVVTATDVDVSERAFDLHFVRSYNSQSLHDAAGDDGDEPAIYGNGWTNNYDAHIVYQSSGVMSVYDGSGARCDYTPNAGQWIPCTGTYTKLEQDPSNACAYWLIAQSGDAEYFVSPNPASCTGFQPGTTGHLFEILGRNENNYVTLTYSFAAGQPRTSANITQIVATHSDGQSLTMSFGHLATGAQPNELAKITYGVSGDLKEVDYSYDPSGAGDLQEVDNKAGHENYSTVSQTYGIQHPIQFACGPRATLSGNSDGSCLHFDYDSDINLIDWGVNGVLNPHESPDLGFGVVQSGYTSAWQRWYTANFVYGGTVTPCGPTIVGTTTMCDSDGHATVWTIDGSDRVQQTNMYSGPYTYLTTTFTWDSNNNIVASTDPAGNQTNYAYDGIGHMTEVGYPQVGDAPSVGSYRPTYLFSYDANSNLLSACSPAYTHHLGKDWSGTPGPSSTPCPTTTGTPGTPTSTVFAYATSDPAEPSGLLTSVHLPGGYGYTFSYNSTAQGGDFGLVTSSAGDTISQTGQPSFQPTDSYTYDSLGRVLTSSNGVGTWQITYDDLNRPTEVTDPTNANSYRCYNDDGLVKYTSTALQYADDGNHACGGGGTDAPHYQYDADGDLVQDSRGYTQATTYKMYDGLDRLVEVQVPADGSIDNGQEGVWRYLYDLSGAGASANLAIGGQTGFQAFGNLFKTQRCTGVSSCSMQDYNGNSYDSLDRPVKRLQYSPTSAGSLTHPGSTPGPLVTWQYNYDATGQAGLLSSTIDPLGTTTTLNYDQADRLHGKTYSDSVTRAINVQYDGDGNIATIQYPSGNTESYMYDGDGNLTQYQEGGGINHAETLEYNYFGNGWRKELSISASGLSFTQDRKYIYKADGRRIALAVAGNGTFSWTYDNAGRLKTQSDPYTGNPITPSDWPGTSNLQYSSMQLASWTANYDANGELSSLALPGGGSFSGLTQDADSQITGANIGVLHFLPPTGINTFVNNVQLGYDIRREYNKLQAQSPATSPSPGPVTLAQLHTVSGHPICVGCAGVSGTDIDANTGAMVNLPPVVGGSCNVVPNLSYDADGRQITVFDHQLSAGACSELYTLEDNRTYDAEDRTLTDTGNQSGNATYVWGPSGRLTNATWGPSGSQKTYTFHWDGNDLLFVTDPSGVDQVDLENFASKNGGSTSLAWTVYDRDFSGSVADEHTGTGDAGLAATSDYENPSFNWNFGIGDITGSYPSAGSAVTPPLVGMERPDGYQVASLTLQGLRMYDSNSAQWTTPDGSAGNVSSPLSQFQYQWNAGNPLTNMDPSGLYSSFHYTMWYDWSPWFEAGNGGGGQQIAQEGPLKEIGHVKTVGRCPAPPKGFAPPSALFDLSAEYEQGAIHGQDPEAMFLLTTNNGPFNFQNQGKQYRPAGNFGLGVYAASAHIPMWAIDEAISGVNSMNMLVKFSRGQDKNSHNLLELNNEINKVVAKDEQWAALGNSWAKKYCR